ncbi:MAG: hypothetical protein AB1422_13365 [bacterium]
MYGIEEISALSLLNYWVEFHKRSAFSHLLAKKSVTVQGVMKEKWKNWGKKIFSSLFLCVSAVNYHLNGYKKAN